MQGNAKATLDHFTQDDLTEVYSYSYDSWVCEGDDESRHIRRVVEEDGHHKG